MRSLVELIALPTGLRQNPSRRERANETFSRIRPHRPPSSQIVHLNVGNMGDSGPDLTTALLSQTCHNLSSVHFMGLAREQGLSERKRDHYGCVVIFCTCYSRRSGPLAKNSNTHCSPVAWRPVLGLDRLARRAQQADPRNRHPSRAPCLHAVHRSRPDLGVRRRPRTPYNQRHRRSHHREPFQHPQVVRRTRSLHTLDCRADVLFQQLCHVDLSHLTISVYLSRCRSLRDRPLAGRWTDLAPVEGHLSRHDRHSQQGTNLLLRCRRHATPYGLQRRY